jgi:hypothetical protein
MFVKVIPKSSLSGRPRLRERDAEKPTGYAASVDEAFGKLRSAAS